MVKACVDLNIYKGEVIENSLHLSNSWQNMLDQGQSEFLLVAAGPWLLERSDWIYQMMQNRQKNREFFFARFPPSVENLKNYLENGPIGNHFHILFLIIRDNLEFLGHLGVKVQESGEIEIDNVMKFESKFPGLMYHSLCSLIDWVTKLLTPKEITLRVISHNKSAVKLYESLGFKVVSAFPLRSKSKDGEFETLEICEEEKANQESKMLFMSLQR